ncbi:MAG: hypothetical protein AAFP90_11760 [Planctomycetota bacterium]
MPTKYLLSLLAAIICVACGAWFLLIPARAQLSDRGYAITLSLYRVCNQRNEPGLDVIRQQIADLEKESPGDSSPIVLRKMVAAAESGDWDAAQQICRRAMEDQIGPPQRTP